MPGTTVAGHAGWRTHVLAGVSLLLLGLLPAVPALGQGPTILQQAKEDEPEEATIAPGANSFLATYLNDETLQYVFPGADSYEFVEGDFPSVDVYRGGGRVGYVFETYDTVRGLGYSRRPFHLLVGVRTDGVLSGVRLLAHVEPIAILGRTDEDFHQYLTQYAEIDTARGISMRLGLSDSVLEGEAIAMRETAGDTSDLVPVDAISRITTSSLLFMDSIMRGARKVMRDRGSVLSADDLGRVLDLELMRKQPWASLLEDGSIAARTVTVGDLEAALAGDTNTALPRSVRYAGADEPVAEVYAAFVTPAGIGINILDRRWYDQYVSAGRSVGDVVVWVGFRGPIGFRDTRATAAAPDVYDKLRIRQGDRTITLTPVLFKSLPFHHIAEAPTLDDQGLFYFAPGTGPDPTLPWTLEYVVDGDLARGAPEDTVPASAIFPVTYTLPARYVRAEPLPLPPVETAALAAIGGGLDWQGIWQDQPVTVALGLATALAVILTLAFQRLIVRHRNLYRVIRVGLLVWIVGWLGIVAGGQLTVLHLMNVVQVPFYGGGFAGFLAEPLITIVGVAALVTLPIWGRSLFCGWLCPYGAMQELLGRLARTFRVRRPRIPPLWTKRLSGVKYGVLAVLLVLTFVDFEWAAWAAGIEPFKTAITLRFDAPTAAVLWAGGLLILALFVERAFCRFLCPLGAGLAILGRIRLFSFLRRRPECGSPCQACGPVCPTGAIDRSGKINMSECFYCLDCQVLHDDKTRCPPLVAQLKARAAAETAARPATASA